MTKTIKFDLPIDGVKVATLDQLRDHFTTEILGHFRTSNTLEQWLRSRKTTEADELVDKLKMVKASKADDDDAAVLHELCQIFQIETDDDAIAAALAGPTGVRGIPLGRIGRPGETFRDCPGCPKLVVVPPGSFKMGSPENEEGRYGDEGLVHEVRIGYLLAVGVYPVTFEEWDACVSDGGCGGHKPDDRGWGRGNRPVIDVSWEDAKRYVGWLSWKTGKGYRLLTESEWEYVARAGTVTRYWWGDGIGRNRANCSGCGSRWDNEKTSPAGSFSANAFGLYDVHGNVREWVEDCWNDDYDGAPTDGSAWESEDCDCDRRTLRGGSWYLQPRDLRSAYRGWYSTGNRSSLAGFRVARTLTP